MRTKDELFRAAQREIAARRQHAVMHKGVVQFVKLRIGAYLQFLDSL